MPLRLDPIGDADVDAVATFLHRTLDQRVTAERWAAAMRSPWQVDPPNHGFLLRAGEDVVGAYLALYSERRIDGRAERFCNLAAWCVAEGHRTGSVRLLKALLAQDGYTFTDLSPSGNVIPLNRRLGFRDLDTTTALVLNLPWPARPRLPAITRRPARAGRRLVTGDPAALRRTLQGEALRIYTDHADAPAARHLLVVDGPAHCHVVFRRTRRKGLPLFAGLVYVSDPALFCRMWRPVARHLLLHHRLVATLAERRIVPGRLHPSMPLRAPRPKMFRSDSLDATQIDDLYSELVAVSW